VGDRISLYLSCPKDTPREALFFAHGAPGGLEGPLFSGVIGAWLLRVLGKDSGRLGVDELGRAPSSDGDRVGWVKISRNDWSETFPEDSAAFDFAFDFSGAAALLAHVSSNVGTYI